MSSATAMQTNDLDGNLAPNGHEMSEEANDALVDITRKAQTCWATTPVRQRLHILRRARSLLATASTELVDAFPKTLDRTRADSLVAEVLPLLAACRFLEREAPAILRTRRLGRRGLPFWLAGIDAEVQRAPFGTVLIIAPANYPLFLAGTQTLQALAAGNAVVWKPGSGGRTVAQVFARTMATAGLPEHLLRITDESVSAATAELDRRPDKIIFTGSVAAGRAVLHQAAERVTPVVAELSGCDAVIVLPSADPQLVVEALAFGMRLNGSATCMAPRRLILVGGNHQTLLERLRKRFEAMPSTPITSPALLRDLLLEAERQGATVVGQPGDCSTRPILVLNADPRMSIARSDIFAPVLSVLTAATPTDVPGLDLFCPFGLTASIFGEEQAARMIAASLNVGTVLINDLIVPTADPRVPFTARKGSGFGATRGREGLLEMTAPKIISARRNHNRRHLASTESAAHETLFTGVIHAQHAPSLIQRLRGTLAALQAALQIGKHDKE